MIITSIMIMMIVASLASRQRDSDCKPEDSLPVSGFNLKAH